MAGENLTKGSIGSLVVYFEGDTKELDKAVKETNKKTGKYEKDIAARNKRIMSSFKKMATISAVAVGVVVAAVAKFAARAQEIQNLAAAVGVSVEKFQELQIVARDTGVTINTLQTSFIKLNQGISQTAEGQINPLTEAFRALGIAVTDAEGNLRSSTEVFDEVADKFASYEDGAQKSALAVQLFGEQGAKLLPVLNKGSEGLRKLSDEARKNGQILEEDTIKQAVEVKKAFDDLADQAEKAGIKLAASLLPQIKALVSWLTKAAGAISETIDGFNELFGIGIEARIRQIKKEIANSYAAENNSWTGPLNKMIGVEKARRERLMRELNELETEKMRQYTFEQMQLQKEQSSQPKVKAPHTRTAEDIAYAEREFEALAEAARRALDEIMESPTETIEAKMNAITAAVRKGTIGFGEFGDMMKSVNEEGQRHLDDLLTASSQVLTALFQDNKAAAIASALINTYQGITKALAAYPPPVSYAMAAAQAAMGFAQVRAIRNTNKNSTSGSANLGGGAGGGAGSGGGEGEGTGGQPRSLFVQGIKPEELYSGRVVAELASTLLQFQRDGGTVLLDTKNS